jgi:hypothetical protein
MKFNIYTISINNFLYINSTISNLFNFILISFLQNHFFKKNFYFLLYKNFFEITLNKFILYFCLDIPDEGLQPKLVVYVLYQNNINFNNSNKKFCL